jgi:hypothetical protein
MKRFRKICACVHVAFVRLMYGWIVFAAVNGAIPAYAQYGCEGAAVCGNEPLPEGHQLYLRNDCEYPIRIAIRYQDWPSKKWVTGGWWHFDANESAYVAHDGARVISVSRVHYYFAQITDDDVDYTWRGGGENVKTLGDLELPMLKESLETDSDDDYVLRLACDVD